MTSHSFGGNVIVITGAAGRLGRRMVQGFALQDATIAAVDLHAEAIAFPQGAVGRPFSASMVDEGMVTALFEQIHDTLGKIDGVVHTVGGWSSQPLLETSLSDWRRLVDLNLTSTFLCFREAVRWMNGGGRLIALASGQGADQGRSGQGAYSAAKAGVIRLVEAVADECKGTGITAHAIAPSTILFDESNGPGVHADDLVELALFLCSPAGAALNSATLRAYGV